MNGLADVCRTITAAAAKRKEVQLVLSIGDQLDPEQIGPLAEQHHRGQACPAIATVETRPRFVSPMRV